MKWTKLRIDGKDLPQNPFLYSFIVRRRSKASMQVLSKTQYLCILLLLLLPLNPKGKKIANLTQMLAAGAGRGAALYLLLLLLSIHKLPLTTQHPLDEACLTTLRSCMEDPAGNLHIWTKPTFAAPCNGSTSDLQGVTCNNGRVHKLSLAGAISHFLSNCTNLQSLDLSSNHLHGSIQPELATLLNLAALNLSSNRLSGAIPPELGLLARLCTFDVSDNCLSGSVPATLRFPASSFQGNEGVYGHPLPPVKNKGMPIAAMVGIGLASLVFSLAVVCVWLRATDSGCGVSEEDGEEGKMSSSCRSVERRHNHLLLVDHELEEHWLLHG